MQILIFTLLFLISFSTLLSTFRAVRAARRFRLIPQGLITTSESILHIGYSIICSGVRSISHIEELLCGEYDRYEIIIVLDRKKYKKAFDRIVSHYHLIEVSNPPCKELPAASIRRLYRSKLRSLRRVVLVDRLYVSEYDDLNAATVVASYEKLIPIGAEHHLYPYSIELLTSIIGESTAKDMEVEMIYCSNMAYGYLFSRERIIEAGGFSTQITKEIPAQNRIQLHLPISYRVPSPPTLSHSLALPLLTITLLLLFSNALQCIALCSTIALQWACLRYMTDYFSSKKCSTRTMLYYLSLKWAFFSSRKFTIS